MRVSIAQGKLLVYDYIHYNQIGHYHCSCGFKRELPKYEVSSFTVSPFLALNINETTFNMKIAGDFNAYNALAAYTVLREWGSMMSLFEWFRIIYFR